MCGRGHDRGPARTRRGVRKRVRIDVRAAIAQLRRQAAAAGGRGIIRGRQGDETRITTECVAIDGRGFDDARGTVDEEAAKTRESVALEFAAHLRGYFGARDDARAVLDDLEDACADFIAVGIAQY